MLTLSPSHTRILTPCGSDAAPHWVSILPNRWWSALLYNCILIGLSACLCWFPLLFVWTPSCSELHLLWGLPQLPFVGLSWRHCSFFKKNSVCHVDFFKFWGGNHSFLNYGCFVTRNKLIRVHKLVWWDFLKYIFCGFIILIIVYLTSCTKEEFFFFLVQLNT